MIFKPSVCTNAKSCPIINQKVASIAIQTAIKFTRTKQHWNTQ